jgi:thermitase
VIWPDAVANPMIAVIDSGVDYTHPDLAGRVTKGTDWVNNDADPMDDNGHGTHVAGIAGAIVNNAKGVAGVSKSMIYAVKVLNAEGSGSYWDIARGIYQAANNLSVKIINMSLGGPCGSSTLQTAAEYATFTKGKLLVVAMGNANTDITAHTVCPASFADPTYSTAGPWTMAVGAAGVFHYDPPFWYIDYSCKAPYSNYADWMTTIAPGTQIFSTVPYNKEFWLGTYGGVPTSTGYAYLQGTSMASPMVAERPRGPSRRCPRHDGPAGQDTPHRYRHGGRPQRPGLLHRHRRQRHGRDRVLADRGRVQHGHDRGLRGGLDE